MKTITILYNGESLNLLANDIKVIQYIKKEFQEFYAFTNEIKPTINKKIILLNNSRLYDLYKNKINRSVNDREIIIIKEKRKVIVVYIKNREEIIIIFKGISTTVIQYIGEMIFSILGKKMENNGVNFVHAAAVSKNNNGILIIGQRNTGKTTMMCELLQKGYDFVANSHVRNISKYG